MRNILSNWRERIFIVKPDTVIKWLGFDISESTVQRYMPKNGKRTTSQNWKTFLKNHSKEIISVDFLTVPTINFKLVHVLVDKIPIVNGLHHIYFRQAD